MDTQQALIPGAQILLYGASNLWLSRRAALAGIRRRFEGRLEIGLANGPGRSYGLRAGNPLVRYLPLSEVEFPFTSVAPIRVAFITDIGNDIAYAQPPERILSWVRTLLTRLENDGYKVLIAGIPVKSLRLINPFLFYAIARLYYPQGTLTREQVTGELEQVEQGILELCRERSLAHIDLNPLWYSWDRFHLKLGAREAYWEALLREFPLRKDRSGQPWSSLRLLHPERYWLFNEERTGVGQYSDLVPQSSVWVK